MPSWVEEASSDYAKRLPGRWKFTIREIAQAKGPNSNVIMAREADALLDAIPGKAHVVVLDNLGTEWSTAQVASHLNQWQTLGKDIVLVIGGADGLDQRIREKANQLWCLSPLTFPHPLVRVIVLEQLYRAQSMLDNHPYHRA